VRPAVRPASPSLVPIVMVNSRRGSTQADSQQWGSGALAEVHKAEGGGGPRVPPGRSPSRVSQTFAECRVRAELAPALQLGLGSVATVIELGKVAEGLRAPPARFLPRSLRCLAVSRARLGPVRDLLTGKDLVGALVIPGGTGGWCQVQARSQQDRS